MDVEEFRVHGKEMIDYICDYISNIEQRRVAPTIKPGYLSNLLPDKAPEDPENWSDIMKDVESAIMPGITHWQHPRFHAYFPSGNSFPSILGDMLSAAIGCIGFSWAASPACTELESIVLNWLAKAIGLPKTFTTTSKCSLGGGVIQGSASDAILLCMLTARNEAIKYLKSCQPKVQESVFLPQLVAYCSCEAHSCVEKAAKILLVKIRILEADDNGSLRGETLKNSINKDKEEGLTPFFISAVVGSTARCSFDNLPEIGNVCKSEPVLWFHVDGAYAGSAFICPEIRSFFKGIEKADSFNLNPNKWLLTNFDCSCLWVKNRFKLTHAMIVDPLYLQHPNSNESIDYRHWGIPLSRRFRSLKLWFVLRTYGISGLQKYIRNHIQLAKYFENLMLEDDRFEVVNDVHLGLVCFRLSNVTDHSNQMLLAKINASGKIHMVPAMVKGKYSIRFCVVAEHATKNDVDFAFGVISDTATEMIKSMAVSFVSIMNVKDYEHHSYTKAVSANVYKNKGVLADLARPFPVLRFEDDKEEENIEENGSTKIEEK